VLKLEGHSLLPPKEYKEKKRKEKEMF